MWNGKVNPRSGETAELGKRHHALRCTPVQRLRKACRIRQKSYAGFFGLNLFRSVDL
ncbi:hypothetical protein ALQ65_200280 [Pseudomonas syringae pv. coriandricola]|uniref:Uncharacterized protein n=1 Tax=Pseudomonas syringae pv. coriandricola TaxID=264453 RepID=A0A3M3JGS4_9PSED|nr:hypothetical protein ALQ65_200280 [Pseudomonas syringae pv. coriandricola]